MHEAEQAGVELVRIADHPRNLGHRREGRGLDLRRATGDDDPGLGPDARRAWRIALRACLTASAVTAQLLTMTRSS